MPWLQVIVERHQIHPLLLGLGSFDRRAFEYLDHLHLNLGAEARYLTHFCLPAFSSSP